MILGIIIASPPLPSSSRAWMYKNARLRWTASEIAVAFRVEWCRRRWWMGSSCRTADAESAWSWPWNGTYWVQIIVFLWFIAKTILSIYALLIANLMNRILCEMSSCSHFHEYVIRSQDMRMTGPCPYELHVSPAMEHSVSRSSYVYPGFLADRLRQLRHLQPVASFFITTCAIFNESIE